MTRLRIFAVDRVALLEREELIEQLLTEVEWISEPVHHRRKRTGSIQPSKRSAF